MTIKRVALLTLLGFFVSCNTTEPLASGEGISTQNSSSRETIVANDTVPAKMSRKAEAGKATENAGDIQMKPASGSDDLANPKASKKTKRN